MPTTLDYVSAPGWHARCPVILSLSPGLGAQVARPVNPDRKDSSVDETRTLRWLRRLTKETSVRGVAQNIGVSHTTVQRWVRSGIPAPEAIQLAIRYRSDPVEAAVIGGLFVEVQVPDLNWALVAEYMPQDVLAREVARRATIYCRTRPDTLRRTGIG